MEDLLIEIWPFMETKGVSILAFIGGISYISLFFYWQICSNMRRLEKYIKKENTTKGYKEKAFPFVSLFDVFYSFKPISKFDKELMGYRRFNETFDVVKAFRKYYSIVFPIVISLAIIGITINECIIDK